MPDPAPVMTVILGLEFMQYVFANGDSYRRAELLSRAFYFQRARRATAIVLADDRSGRFTDKFNRLPVALDEITQCPRAFSAGPPAAGEIPQWPSSRRR